MFKNSYTEYGLEMKDVFTARLTEKDLHDFAKKYKLILLSSYDDYINVDNPLSWKCRVCDFEFEQTISNIKKAKIPCGQCRKNPDIRFNYEEIKEQLKTGLSDVVSNNKWNIMKKILWEDINQFILTNRKTIFENKLNNDSIPYVIQKVFSFLNDKWELIRSISNERKETIKRSIYTIFLLRKEDLLAQFEIFTIVRYSSSKPVKEIRDFLGIPLPKHGVRECFDDESEQLRECRICGEVKSYFKFRKDKEGYLRWDCKECENKNRALLRHEKKFIAAIFITLKKNCGTIPAYILDYVKQGLKFNVDIKCFDCGLGVDRLPSHQFDHVQPHLKTINWRNLRDKSLEEIIFTLDREECELVCANCHQLREAYVFKQYKEDIFTNNNSAPIDVDRRAVDNYIKKYILLKEFTNGTCPHCGESIVLLPIFQTHHTNPTIKKYSWVNLRFKEIDEIRKIIVKEKIEWLCCNCHEFMKDKYFSKYKAKIFKKYLSFD